jgi:hypothetical protein
MPPPKEWAIFVATQKAVFAFRPDYRKVQAPGTRLSTLSPQTSITPPTGCQTARMQARAAKAEVWWREKGHALVREPVEQFRRQIPHGEIVELNGAKHYVFTGDTADQVAAKIREFLLRR